MSLVSLLRNPAECILILAVLLLPALLPAAGSSSHPLIGSLNTQAEAAGLTYYVDKAATGSGNGSSWTDAFADLQAALAAAASGDVIHVAAGVYRPTAGLDRTATFQLKTGVALLGGFPAGGGTRDPKTNITILSGDLLGNDNSNVESGEPTRSDNSYHVVTGSGTDSTAVFDGFTISSGHADNYDALGGTGSFGAGMCNVSGSPAMQNMVFMNNYAMNHGAGMYNKNSSPAIIDATFSNNRGNYGSGMYNDNSNTIVRNTTFSNNASQNWGGAMNNNNGSCPELINVTFSGNSAGTGGGMYNQDPGTNPVLMNVTFFGNSAGWGAGGIENYNGANPTITNCILWGDSGSPENEITGTPVVTYSIVQGGYAGEGNRSDDPLLGPLGSYGGFGETIPLLPGSSAIDTATAIGAPSADQRGLARPQGAGYDIGAFESDAATLPQPTVTGIDPGSMYPVASITVNIHGTNFSGTPVVLIRKSGSSNIAATNVLLLSPEQLSCTLDITGAAAGAWDVVVINPDGRSSILLNGFTLQNLPHPDIYVDQNCIGSTHDGSSWVAAFTDLSGVLAAAGSGATIHVAQGTYKPTAGNDRAKTFALKSGVVLLGGYPTAGPNEARNTAVYSTTLSGDIGVAGSASDNSYHVVTGSGTDSTAVIEGFTVTGGTADGDVDSNGGGMYNYDGSPTIRDVIFSNNSASWSGGGIYSYLGDQVMTDVTFSSNSAAYGGGIYNDTGSTATLTRVTLSNNSAEYGGGMYNFSSTQTLTDVVFADNPAAADGGGMYNDDSSNATLTNVTFSGNSAVVSGGGIYNYNNTLTLTNATLSSNSAEFGAAMYNDSGSIQMLMNVTFNGNTAVTDGGGIYNSGNLSATNCILWGNAPYEIYDFYGIQTITYSVVQGGYTGEGNLTDDPMLGALGNYGGYAQTIPLLPGSSAIDAGTATGAPLTDQRGVARPQGTASDMGSFEVLVGYTLTVGKTGDGVLTSTGIDCGSDCTETYSYNTDIALYATPASCWVLDGWGGTYSCAGGSPCAVRMTDSWHITATFILTGNAWNVTTGRRDDLLQTAVENLGTTAVQELRTQAFDSNEAITMNTGITLALKGGYDCDYDSNSTGGWTGVAKLTIEAGMLVVENIVVAGP